MPVAALLPASTSFSTSFFQAQVGNDAIELRVLLFRLLRSPCLVYMQTTILFAPMIVCVVRLQASLHAKDIVFPLTTETSI